MLGRRTAPKRITLPNGRTFIARYERVSQKNLLSNLTIKRKRTMGPRQQRKHKTQTGSGMLGNVFRVGKNMITLGAITKGISLG